MNFCLGKQNIARNPEQLQAVIQIVSGSSHPHPYLLYGPPGTGKTVTLAEAIKQIWKKDLKFRIIVATPSNSAADVIALRLKEDIPEG
jgi:Cdc6-like AAA superfamily ATPase